MHLYVSSLPLLLARDDAMAMVSGCSETISDLVGNDGIFERRSTDGTTHGRGEGHSPRQDDQSRHQVRPVLEFSFGSLSLSALYRVGSLLTSMRNRRWFPTARFA